MADESKVIEGEVVEKYKYTDIVPVDASDYSLSMDKTQKNLAVLRQYVQENFTDEVDYGAPFPGSPKSSLLLAGAEKFNLLFNVYPRFVTIERITDQKTGFCLYHLGCELVNKNTGQIVGYGEGSCNVYESKFRYRNANRVCPNCGKETIIKGKEEYGGGWLCYKAKGGCGFKFPDGDKSIEEQQTGKVENENFFDLWNNILKYAEKRAMVCAVVYTGGVSELFTQDGDDYQGNEEAKPKKAPLPVKPKTAPKGDTAVTNRVATTVVQPTASDASVEMVTLSDGKTKKKADELVPASAYQAFERTYVGADKTFKATAHLKNHLRKHFHVDTLPEMTWGKFMALVDHVRGMKDDPKYYPEEEKVVADSEYLQKLADSLGIDLKTILEKLGKVLTMLTPEEVKVISDMFTEAVAGGLFDASDTENLVHLLEEAFKA